MISQREIEVTKLQTDIQRSKEEGNILNKEIECAQRGLREAHQVKDKQHERIFQLTGLLKKAEQHNFGLSGKANQCTVELNSLQERGQRLEQVAMQKHIQFDDANARFDIGRAEVGRCGTELSCLQKDCESANQRNNFLLET